MSRIQHLLSLSRSLPPTLFRPQGSPNMADAIEAIVHRHFPTADSPAPSTSASVAGSATAPPVGAAGSAPLSDGTTTRPLGPSEERAIEGMIATLERIQSNQSIRDFPLRHVIAKPQSDPLYYKRIVDGTQMANKGIGRAWWKRFFQVKGEA